MIPLPFLQLVSRALLISIAAIMGFTAAAGVAADDKFVAQETQGWRSRLICGRNSLYLFLKSHGYHVTYPELHNSVPLGELGSSFGDLRRAAEGFGATVDVLRTSLDRLASCSLPAIVLLEATQSPSGHFVLLVDVDDTNVLITDPTSTSSVRMPRAKFLRSWSGFAMVHRSIPLGRTALSLAAIALGGLLVVSELWRRRRSKCGVAALGLLLAMLGGCGFPSVGTPAEHDPTTTVLDQHQSP
jgi:ABC-type bacteriocin/lantibiotic exporter with double-glycine peptidase domain